MLKVATICPSNEEKQKAFHAAGSRLERGTATNADVLMLLEIARGVEGGQGTDCLRGLLEEGNEALITFALKEDLTAISDEVLTALRVLMKYSVPGRAL